MEAQWGRPEGEDYPMPLLEIRDSRADNDVNRSCPDTRNLAHPEPIPLKTGPKTYRTVLRQLTKRVTEGLCYWKYGTPCYGTETDWH